MEESRAGPVGRDRPSGVELALETSRRETSLVLEVAGRRHADEHGTGTHASDLVPRLAALLARAGLAAGGPLPLRAVFVGLGPGSYTGLRVGIATAHGLARASGALLYGLSSFEALAHAELAPGEEGAVLLDARAGRVYFGRFARTPAGLLVRAAPVALAPADVAARCRGVDVLLADPEILAATGVDLAPGVRLASGARPSAGALLALARARLAAGELAPGGALEPLYLAPFGRPERG